jgi:hypothetical protein
MQDAENPNLSLRNLERDPIITDPQPPVAAEGPTEWRAEPNRLRSEPCFDQSADTPTGFSGNLWKVIGANCWVIARGV